MRLMRLHARRERPDVVAGSVTTLELFFDLVFVFTITQLTATLGRDHGWAGVGRTALLLALMWWMHGGYAWLTNAALIVVGGALAGTATYVCWAAALAAETTLPRLAARTPLLAGAPGFDLHPPHFVERHGLMLIIVLGESVLAIGVGVSGGV